MIRLKKLSALVLAFVLMYSMCSIKTEATECEIVIDSVGIYSGGMFELIGHVTNVPLDTQLAFIIGRESIFDGDELTEDDMSLQNLAYIDQVGTGNNGTFLISFKINSIFEHTTLAYRIGSAFTSVYEGKINVGKLPPPGIEVIKNNSVIYGRDAYLITGEFYTPDNIAESISFGGNNIYFKIGGLWYNLLDEKATDNSFLVKENAVSTSEVESILPRQYYYTDEAIELRY